MISCPHCQQPVFRRSANGSKLKLSRSPVVLSKSGDIEINCPQCKRGIILGQIGTTLLKAQPRLIIRPFSEGT